MHLVAIHSLLPCLLVSTTLKLSLSVNECGDVALGALPHKITCESAKQSWTADAEEEDKSQSLQLLQLGIDQVAHRPCPMPDLHKFEPVGKGCSAIEGCLRGNHGYHNLKRAWKICGQTAYCGAVLQSPDGKFYLRRSNDPNEKIEGMKLYKFSCLAGSTENKEEDYPPDEFSRNSEAKQVAKWKRVEDRIHQERAMVKEHSLLPPDQEFGGQPEDLTEDNEAYQRLAEEQAALHEQKLQDELAEEQGKQQDEAYDAEYADLGAELEEGEERLKDEQDAEQKTVKHDPRAHVKAHEEAEWQRLEDKIEQEGDIVRQHSLLPPEQEAAELAEAERLEEERQLEEAEMQEAEEAETESQDEQKKLENLAEHPDETHAELRTRFSLRKRENHKELEQQLKSSEEKHAEKVATESQDEHKESHLKKKGSETKKEA
mmetsp:Transcript_127015/g.230605  ORF Transcript_127015/g.230605 Transcript_127015/m.230605 type:complete len:431 (+) Transcript_127015:51-1343(+)